MGHKAGEESPRPFWKEPSRSSGSFHSGRKESTASKTDVTILHWPTPRRFSVSDTVATALRIRVARCGISPDSSHTASTPALSDSLAHSPPGGTSRRCRRRSRATAGRRTEAPWPYAAPPAMDECARRLSTHASPPALVPPQNLPAWVDLFASEGHEVYDTTRCMQSGIESALLMQYARYFMIARSLVLLGQRYTNQLPQAAVRTPPQNHDTVHTHTHTHTHASSRDFRTLTQAAEHSNAPAPSAAQTPAPRPQRTTTAAAAARIARGASTPPYRRPPPRGGAPSTASPQAAGLAAAADAPPETALDSMTIAPRHELTRVPRGPSPAPSRTSQDAAGCPWLPRLACRAWRLRYTQQRRGTSWRSALTDERSPRPSSGP